jgi:threonine aldolase
LVGTKAFIKRARHLRKMLGGGMRQVGIIAAAGIYSLENMIERLDDDHARARKLADGLKQIKGLVVDAGSPSTNMVYFNLSDDVRLNAEQVSVEMGKRGVVVGPEDEKRFRLVTHYWIDDAAVNKTVSAFREVLQ